MTSSSSSSSASRQPLSSLSALSASNKAPSQHGYGEHTSDKIGCHLTQSVDRYMKLEKLGEGNYGSVYKAKDLECDDEIVALKRIKLDEDDDGVPSTAIREISLLNDMRHENIIQLRDVVFNADKQLYLAFDFLDKDLRRYMDCVGLLPCQFVKHCMKQILAGMQATHQQRILHRDMKPQNVLVDRLGCVKIADWGLARTTAAHMKTITHEVATLWYRAPEILMGTRTYSEAVDIWSVGCIMAELSSDDPLFPGDSEIATLFLMFQLLGTPSVSTWPSIISLPDYKASFPQWHGLSTDEFNSKFSKLDVYGIDLLRRMLSFDPQHRISARQALNHPYFDDLDVKLAKRQAVELGKLLDTNDGQARRIRRHMRH